MIVSANDLARTRICRAHSCPDDAEHYSLFCDRHDRRHKAGVAIPLHEVPKPGPEMLNCSLCGTSTPVALLAGRRCRRCMAKRVNKAKRAKREQS